MHGDAGAMLGAKLTCDSAPWGLLCGASRVSSLLAGFILSEGQGGRRSPKALISGRAVEVDGLAKRLKRRSFRVLLEGKAVCEHGSYQAPASPSQMVEDVVNEVS